MECLAVLGVGACGCCRRADALPSVPSLQVVRKADWQGNQNKGQRAYAQPAAGNRSWRLEPGVGTGSAPAGNAAAGVAGS